MLTSRITAPQPVLRAPAARPGPRPPHQALQLAVAVVEAMMGRRPLHHLRSRLDPQAFQRLVALRTSGRFTRSRMGGLRSQMPSPTAVEVSIRISLGPRWLACVLRLDDRSDWGCSDFLVLGVDR